MDPRRIAEIVVKELNNIFVDNFIIEEVMKGGRMQLGIMKDVKSTATPVVYAEAICDKLREGYTLGEVMEELREIYSAETPDDAGAIIEILSNGLDVPKEMLSVRLLSKERSGDALDNFIYRSVGGDLILVLDIVIKTDEGIGRAMLPKSEYEDRKDKMFEDALQNLDAKYFGLGNGLFCITNEEGHYGASCLFAKGMIDQVTKDLGDDFYIIPCSVHEVLAFSKDNSKDVRELKAMIETANGTVVSEDDILSQHLYECKDGKVSIVQ